MRISLANKSTLERVLKRKKWHEFKLTEVDLRGMLKGILKWANEFVPSESGSILLDDPVLDEYRRKPGRLYFVACYGKGSLSITGTSIPIDIGIVGKTYRVGKAYISKNVAIDANFYKGIDEKTKYQTKSIVCVPIKIKGITIGALELINSMDKINFDQKDLTLLKIFAGYTSTLVQNSLDAKKFGELSVRDNLTGLFNDRYFFDRLSKEIRHAIKRQNDLSLLFLDLDRFKEVNDTYGHLTGSHLLREVGEILMAYTENKKFVPIRYGGDEFIVILPGITKEGARDFAEALRKTIEGYTFIEENLPKGMKALRIKNLITASLGIASLERDVRKSEKALGDALIKAADTAMYASKQSGKNKVTVAN